MRFVSRPRGLYGMVLSAFLISSCASRASAPPTGGSAPASEAGSANPVVEQFKSFAAMNQEIGFGRLRVMQGQERPTERDIVIYRSLPNEVPRVAGMITTVSQTPLSHVNLRAVQDKVPNAYIGDALGVPTVKALVGKYVRYEVRPTGYVIEPATQKDVEDHFAKLRPSKVLVPVRDLSVHTIASLDDIDFSQSSAYGVKAANVATLGTFKLGGVDVPKGFAVPFYFYSEFMVASGLDQRVRGLLDDQEFRSDLDYQEAELIKVRKAIESAPMPDWMMSELGDWQQKFPGKPLRCRSSTNNEDLPNFSGAGLYDSKTQRPEEGHLSKCVKQVYASLWSQRAFLEREFYRIDHLRTAMGVLVHPNFDDELVNGVAVSTDPLYQSDAFYVNAQKGEDLVTNPKDSSIPEEILIYPDGKTYIVAHSNLVEPGKFVLDKDQIAALHANLKIIRDRFASLYGVGSDDRFAIEIEFKITATGHLAIKQARPWVFR
jgi:Pyruvate phosphate dikinase, AMP/ATP-binding domain